VSELDLFTVAWCAIALFLGGLIKGTLGVGTPLLTVPMMAMILPVQLAVVIMAIPVVVANVWQLVQADHTMDTVRRFWPTFVTLLAGTWIGVEILSSSNEQLLLLVVGIIVIAITFFQGSNYRMHLPPSLEKPAGAGFGLVSGIIGGLSSMFGPMLIIYLVSLGSLGKNQFVSTISFLYVAAVVPWTVTLIIYRILDLNTLILSSLAVIPVTIGLLLGQSLRKRISEQRFHRLVLIVLLCSGGMLLWRAYTIGL
jgi:uncharacterized membrane protein YfcA